MSEAIRRMVVAYDIADNNRRDRVAVALQEFGERVQFSVFMVDGRPATFVRLRAVLNALILPEADNIMFCDLGPRDSVARKAVRHLGRARQLTGDDEALII